MATIISTVGVETEVVYGKVPAGTVEQVKAACSNINWVRNDINNIKESFIKLGFHLAEIKFNSIYKCFGYDDFYEFCDNNFHLSSSTVRRHIQLWIEFAEHGDGKIKMNLAEDYKDYSYSQLCEMLSIPDKAREQIKPEMTIAQIREYKASLREKSCTTSHKNCRYDRKIICTHKNIPGCFDCCKICARATECGNSCDFIQNKLEPKVCDVAQTEPDLDESEPENVSFLNGIIALLNDVIKFIDDGDCDTAAQMVCTLRNRLNSIIEDN